MPHRIHQLKRSSILIAALFCLQLFPVDSRAQASRATAYRKADLQIGGYFTYVKPDYTPQNFRGFGGYLTYDFKPHWGVEASVRQANTTGANHVYERTYEIGGRYVFHKGPFNPYARASFGRGVFNFPYIDPNPPIANLAYNLFSFAGGVDYNLIPAINLRADYEYQSWLSFPPRGLKPQALSVGVAYHFH